MTRMKWGPRRWLAAVLTLAVGTSLGLPCQAERPSFTLQVKAGTLQEFQVPLSPDPFRNRSLVVRLLPDGGAWPSPEELAVGLGSGGTAEGREPAGVLPFREGGRLVQIWVKASPCSPSREVAGVVEVWLAASQSEPARKLLDLPFTVSIANSADACSVARAAPFLAGTATLALILLPWGAWLKSHFISPGELLQRINHQVKNANGSWKGDPAFGNTEIQKAISRDLQFFKRALAWLRANPLCFVLPGGIYQECIRIQLNRDGTVCLQLQPERCFLRRASLSKDRFKGHLFAAAEKDRLAFVGLPDASNRICDAEVEGGWLPLRWQKDVILVYRRERGPQEDRRFPDKAWKIIVAKEKR